MYKSGFKTSVFWRGGEGGEGGEGWDNNRNIMLAPTDLAPPPLPKREKKQRQDVFCGGEQTHERTPQRPKFPPPPNVGCRSLLFQSVWVRKNPGGISSNSACRKKKKEKFMQLQILLQNHPLRKDKGGG